MIVLDPKLTHTAKLARVAFTTSHYGINTGGTAYRSDGVPIELRPCLDSKYPSDEEVIRAIYKRVEQLLKTRKKTKGANNKRRKAA
jgi:formylmethanofuran dehydrogenase subunit B